MLTKDYIVKIRHTTALGVAKYSISYLSRTLVAVLGTGIESVKMKI